MKIRNYVFGVLFLAGICWLFSTTGAALAATNTEFPSKPITFLAGWPGGVAEIRK